MQTRELKISEVMSPKIRYVKHNATVREAAQLMVELDCGFLPISDENESRLQGVITDRDIVLRAVAQGKSPDDTMAADCKSDKVLYCYQDQDISEAVASMQSQQVWRLIVLDNSSDKNLAGVISVGDILRAGLDESAMEAAREIEKAA